ncbi:unnamed protein product [Paramecium primaurelia]|uniref:Uncharacterized protein n=1 Tax=Paramecium primaurelia TaxID=5886 RepID=A0A8S1K5C3_PARPR|nr:unnamed protein product [Paramecium primaurelia]
MLQEKMLVYPQYDMFYMFFKGYIKMLIFMGRVKRLEGLDLQQEVNEIIEVTEIKEDRDKLIKEFSGSSKRKLLLANSFDWWFFGYLFRPTNKWNGQIIKKKYLGDFIESEILNSKLFKQPPVYSFKSQITAIFLRNFYTIS